MTKLLGSLALAIMAVALTPKSALAKEGVPIEASFTVTFTGTANTSGVTYCGAAILPRAVVAVGAGYSSLGALSFELLKTASPAPAGIFQGCTTLKSPNGDALYANYAGTNNGATGDGTLTFTGGTGRFEGATGSAKFTGVFVNLFPTLIIFPPGTIPYNQGMAFYLVEGTVFLEKEKETD